MIYVDWKGKVGYGDIISPICYAHNISYKLQEKVTLVFHWPHDKFKKQHHLDPETLWQRADYINNVCLKDQTNVAVEHNFRSPLEVEHTNYEWRILKTDVLHNYWIPININKPITDTVVVNTTTNNTQSLKAYGKPWKDPLVNDWDTVVQTLSRKYKVVTVNYRTPIHELIELLLTARGFFGYHGTAAWIAKFMHTPSVVFGNTFLTHILLSYAHIETKKEELDKVLSDPEKYFNISCDLIRKTQENYKHYMLSQKHIEYLKHDV